MKKYSEIMVKETKFVFGLIRVAGPSCNVGFRKLNRDRKALGIFRVEVPCGVNSNELGW